MTILTHNAVAKRAEMDNYIFSLFSEYHDDSSLQDAGKKQRTAVKKNIQNNKKKRKQFQSGSK